MYHVHASVSIQAATLGKLFIKSQLIKNQLSHYSINSNTLSNKHTTYTHTYRQRLRHMYTCTCHGHQGYQG